MWLCWSGCMVEYKSLGVVRGVGWTMNPMCSSVWSYEPMNHEVCS